MPIFHHFNQRTVQGPQGYQGVPGSKGFQGADGAQASGNASSIQISTSSYNITEVTNSTSWVKLTNGPTTSLVVTGTSAIVIISATLSSAEAIVPSRAGISVSVNSDMTQATLEARGFLQTAATTGQSQTITAPILITGLTPGTSNTFSMVCKSVSGTNWNFLNRSIIVIPY